MVHARSQHPNAPLTPEGRRRMVACVMAQGWSIAATAKRFQVDPKTVRKWRDRYLIEGDAGLVDRSSRPHRSLNRTPRWLRQRVIQLRLRRRWGADHIGHEVGLAASTVRHILHRAGLGRLDRGDRATGTRQCPQRYQRERPGELIHVDVKKLAGIADGGGWRTRGRGYPGEHTRSRKAGYRYLHSAVDDRTRIVYSEILHDELAITATGFWKRWLPRCRRHHRHVGPTGFMVGRNAPKKLKRTARTVKARSQAEAQTFLGSVRGDRLEALWILLLTSGLRRGEALGLRWQDVDLTAGAVTLRPRTWCRGVPV